MKTGKLTRASLVGTVAFTAMAAMAHAHLTGDSHTHSGLASGLVHPFNGLDHLLAMLAVGLWAAQRGGRLLWALPVAFVGLMMVGGVAGMAGLPLPLVEPGIAASVLVLGLVVAMAARIPGGACVALAGVFAVFHGHAHGTEFPAGSMAVSYIAGFAFSTAVLHGAGMLLGLAAKRLVADERRSALVLRGGGAMVAAGGLVLALVG